MKHLNMNQMQSLQGGLCVNDGINGIEHNPFLGNCSSVCNLLNLVNPTYSAPCTL